MKIDGAIENFRNGKSTLLLLTMPPRHGKSDIVSRYLPPKFLAEFPNKEVIIVSYGTELSTEFSDDTRDIMDTENYKLVFDYIERKADKDSKFMWKLKGFNGKVTYTAIEKAITGKGGHLIIIDDYLKNATEASSQVKRDKIWRNFTSSIMTRRYAPSIMILLATQWHEDDLIGRIEDGMKTIPNFPQFKKLKFPAEDPKYLLLDRPHKSKYLFPALFPDSFYEQQKAICAEDGSWNALYMCNPRTDKSSLFDITKIQKVSECPFDTGILVSSWDLASSEKTRGKANPDFTVGITMATGWEFVEGIPFCKGIYITSSAMRGQWKANERDLYIKKKAVTDGPSVKVVIEAIAGYKDTYTRLKKDLLGVSTVIEAHVIKSEKFIRAEGIEGLVNEGRFYIDEKFPFMDALMEEFELFPIEKYNSKDDIVDSITNGFNTSYQLVIAKPTMIHDLNINFKRKNNKSTHLFIYFDAKHTMYASIGSQGYINNVFQILAGDLDRLDKIIDKEDIKMKGYYMPIYDKSLSDELRKRGFRGYSDKHNGKMLQSQSKKFTNLLSRMIYEFEIDLKATLSLKLNLKNNRMFPILTEEIENIAFKETTNYAIQGDIAWIKAMDRIPYNLYSVAFLNYIIKNLKIINRSNQQYQIQKVII